MLALALAADSNHTPLSVKVDLVRLLLLCEEIFSSCVIRCGGDSQLFRSTWFSIFPGDALRSIPLSFSFGTILSPESKFYLTRLYGEPQYD